MQLTLRYVCHSVDDKNKSVLAISNTLVNRNYIVLQEIIYRKVFRTFVANGRHLGF